jgi:hypothetical protein
MTFERTQVRSGRPRRHVCSDPAQTSAAPISAVVACLSNGANRSVVRSITLWVSVTLLRLWHVSETLVMKVLQDRFLITE